MKKIIKLTENDLTRIVRRVIEEQEMSTFEESLDNLYNQIELMSSNIIKKYPSLASKVKITLSNLSDFIGLAKEFRANDKGTVIGKNLQQMLMTTYDQIPNLVYLFESLSKRFMNGDPGDWKKTQTVNEIDGMINKLKNLPIKK
jgi:ATP-dependent RNA circularization protein (DNA/RNA ligase family)